jgi:hypothetical protein
MPAPASVKRSKSHLVIALVFIGASLVAGPYVLASLELMAPLKPLAGVVLAVAYAGVLLKALVGYLTTHEFRYDKSAYDLSLLVFGGVLTCTALQIVTVDDLYPGLDQKAHLCSTGSDTTPWAAPNKPGKNHAPTRSASDPSF